MTRTEKNNIDYYIWNQPNNTPKEDDQIQLTEARVSDLQHIGTWIKSDPKVHEGNKTLITDERDACRPPVWLTRELGYAFGWGAWFDVVFGVASVAEDGDELGCAAAVACITLSVASYQGDVEGGGQEERNADLPQTHDGQSDTRRMLERYMEQEKFEEPWKPVQNNP